MRVRYCITLPLALSLGGCSNNDLSDLEAYAAQIKQRLPPPIDPVPEIALVEPFEYHPGQRRDPFVMDKETAAIIPMPQDPGGMAPDPKRPRQFLEHFALDGLLMRGSLQQDERIWALVYAKEDQTLHRVGIGDYLGQNHGRIIRVSEQRIDLIERVQDGTGRWMDRKASIALTQDAKRK